MIMNMFKCLECDMPEREEWATAGNHKCNIVTDPQYPAILGRTYRIGKRRFIKIVE